MEADYLTWSDFIKNLEEYRHFLECSSSRFDYQYYSKDNNNKVIVKSQKLNGSECLAKIDSKLPEFSKHYELIDAEQTYKEPVRDNILSSHTAMIVKQDYSERIHLLSFLQSQNQYMQKATRCLHGTIILYRDVDGNLHKWYLYTGGDHQNQGTEITWLAISAAKNFIEKQFNIVIDKIGRESDNASSQYKCGLALQYAAKFSLEANVEIIEIFGVPQHGKGENDMACGKACKSIIYDAILTGRVTPTNWRECLKIVQDKPSRVPKLFQHLDIETLKPYIDLCKGNIRDKNGNSKAKFSLKGIKSMFMFKIDARQLSPEATHYKILSKDRISSDDDLHPWTEHKLLIPREFLEVSKFHEYEFESEFNLLD